VDERGRRVGMSKDLDELRSRFAERARTTVATVTATPGRELERGDVAEFVDLPVQVEGGGAVGFPALVDEGGAVAVRVFATRPEAERAHPRGVRRLLARSLPSPVSYVQEHLTPAEKLALAASPYPSTAALLDDALLASV